MIGDPSSSCWLRRPCLLRLGARSFASAVAATAKTPGSNESFSNNIYTRLGVRPVINCVGTWTYLTASLELPEVRAACEAASHYFVDLFELQAAAGRRLAELSGAESGMVTSGSAGAISAGTAACIAGSDPKKIYQLPDTTGMKGEVAFLGPRTPWDSCIRLAGAKLVVAPTVDDLPGALTSQTAMVYTTWGDERLQKILKIAKAAGVPVFLDQAGHIPPYSNLTTPGKDGRRSFLYQRWKGPAWTASLRTLVRPQGPDRRGPVQLQPLGRRHMPAHEGRQGRDHGRPRRPRLLVQACRQRSSKEPGSARWSASRNWCQRYRESRQKS